jgi:hypothetical protein
MLRSVDRLYGRCAPTWRSGPVLKTQGLPGVGESRPRGNPRPALRAVVAAGRRADRRLDATSTWVRFPDSNMGEMGGTFAGWSRGGSTPGFRWRRVSESISPVHPICVACVCC